MNPRAEPYRLTFEERPEYLYVHVTSETITEEIAWKYIREIAKRCSETKSTRMMLHRDIPETLNDGMQLCMALNLQKMNMGAKTAIVNPYLSNADTLNLAINIGRKHGVDFALFNNDADAEEWLLTEPD